MKYKFSVAHKICLAIVVFLLIFYFAAGYGPWDFYFYLLFFFIILIILIIDFIIQLLRK